jgi:YD repeat-containing protein
MPDGQHITFTNVQGSYQPSLPNFLNQLVITPADDGNEISLTMKGSKMKYHFDNPIHGKLTSIEDRNGNSIVLHYDANHNLIAIEDANGRMTSFELNDMGRIIKATDPLGREALFEYGFTNEGGLGGKIRVLKNITGLWLVQECRRNWTVDGKAPSFAELEKEALATKPFQSFIDPDDVAFAAPCDMPANIQAYCKRTNQPVPQTRGEIIRTAVESLAFRYKTVFTMLEVLGGAEIKTLHIVGGGTQDRMLNQLTANALNRTVIAGPTEATAIGNILAQLMAANEITSLDEGRDIVRASFEQETYEPADTESYAQAYTRFHEITGA